ncbi:hypothetical protein RKD21_003776 [Streptomyces albogriseolus]|uniref:Uncharacterized protein n=1 Tax=Streptomyces albogriseolus TaxID=1887 RepID=A0ACC6UPR6_STRAO
MPGRVGQRLPGHAVQQPLGDPARLHRPSAGLAAHRQPGLGGAGDELSHGLPGRSEGERLVGVLAQHADDAVQPVRGVRGRRAQVGRRRPVPFGQVRRHLEDARPQREQAQLVAEGVVHVLRDARPLAQPRPLLGEPLLLLQPGRPQPAGGGQLTALPPVAPAQPGQDTPEEEGAGHHQPRRDRIAAAQRDPHGADGGHGGEAQCGGPGALRPQPEQHGEHGERGAVGEAEQRGRVGQAQRRRQGERGEGTPTGEGGGDGEHARPGRLLPQGARLVQPEPVGAHPWEDEPRPEQTAAGERGGTGTVHAPDATSARRTPAPADRQVPCHLPAGMWV